MRARHLITAIALVFFSLPIALRVIGVKAEEVENHKLAASPSLSQGWDIFPQTTRFFTDRMPLRKQAITANRRISQSVFDTTPTYGGAGSANPVAPVGAKVDADGNPIIRATEGKDGWLFMTNSLERGCEDAWPVPLAKATSDWSALRETLVARGKQVVILVAPDKESVYSDYLPDKFATKDCFGDREKLWASIDDVDGIVPLRQTLRDARREQQQQIYRTKDSHWNRLGSSYMVRAALESVGGTVRVKDSELKPTTISEFADLLDAVGTPGYTTETAVNVVRKPGAPKVPGRTLLITDSFGFEAFEALKPYFEDFHVLNWDYQGGIGPGDSDLKRAKEMAAADRIIIETVERNYVSRSAAAEHIDNLLTRNGR